MTGLGLVLPEEMLPLEKEMRLGGQKTGPHGEPPSHVNLLQQEAAQDSQY